MSHHVFAIVPIEACADPRLTSSELRVLIALLSFRNKDTNLCCPKREAIADRTGMTENQITKATTGLVRHGWLKKDGKGGAGVACQYTVTVPELAPFNRESGAKTVPGTERFLERNGSISGTKTVPGLAPPYRTDKGTEKISPSLCSGEGARENDDEHALQADVNPSRNANPASDGPQDRAPGKPEAKRETRRTCLRADFELPDEWAAWASRDSPWLDVQRTFAIFRDHWVANRKPMADWFATWRNWVRREGQFSNGARSNGSKRDIDWHDPNW